MGASNVRRLTAELAAALGLPAGTTRAVLILDVNDAPRLVLRMLPSTDGPRPSVRPLDAGTPARLRSVEFMLRLERFADPPRGQRDGTLARRR